MKLFLKRAINSLALASYESLSFQVFLGFRILESTPGTLAGTKILKLGSGIKSVFYNSPSRIEVSILLVTGKSILSPVP